MYRFKVLVYSAAIISILSIAAFSAEIVLEFEDLQWSSPSSSRKIELAINLGFGISDIDSVKVTFSGVVNMGGWSHCLEPNNCASGDCWDAILVTFLEEINEPGSCHVSWSSSEYDGEVPCVGAFLRPLGDGIGFTQTVKFAQIDPTGDPEYPSVEIIAPVTSFGPFLEDGSTTLKLKRLDGYPPYECNNGIPDLDRVSVTIYFDEALPVTQSYWGSVKSHYR